MTARIRRRLLIVVGAAAAIVLLIFHYKERDSYRCQVCFSEKGVFQWKLGSWMGASVPLTPSWERVTASHFLTDFFHSDHVHEWEFAQGSPYIFFGTKWAGCALGSGRHVSELCMMYESSPEFRTFIQTKLRDGSLAKSNLIALVSSPRTGGASRQKEDADALLETFFKQ